jgi:hypothetical protein
VTPVCPGCRTPLPPEILGSESRIPCPSCRVALEVEVFPALARPIEEAAAAPQISAEGESTCFYHAGYRAAVPCDACGRFLCRLCDLPIGPRHLCPECVHRAREEKTAGMVTERMLWDRLALSLATLPVITLYFTVLTAPAAIVVALRHWRTPGSLVTPGRWRFVAAILFATLQLGAWAGMIYLITQVAPGPSSD